MFLGNVGRLPIFLSSIFLSYETKTGWSFCPACALVLSPQTRPHFLPALAFAGLIDFFDLRLRNLVRGGERLDDLVAAFLVAFAHFGGKLTLSPSFHLAGPLLGILG